MAKRKQNSCLFVSLLILRWLMMVKWWLQLILAVMRNSKLSTAFRLVTVKVQFRSLGGGGGGGGGGVKLKETPKRRMIFLSQYKIQDARQLC